MKVRFVQAAHEAAADARAGLSSIRFVVLECYCSERKNLRAQGPTRKLAQWVVDIVIEPRSLSLARGDSETLFAKLNISGRGCRKRSNLC